MIFLFKFKKVTQVIYLILEQSCSHSIQMYAAPVLLFVHCEEPSLSLVNIILLVLESFFLHFYHIFQHLHSIYSKYEKSNSFLKFNLKSKTILHPPFTSIKILHLLYLHFYILRLPPSTPTSHNECTHCTYYAKKFILI